jgi:CHAT domain
MISVAVSPPRICAGDVASLQLSLTNEGVGPCTNIVFRLRLPAEITKLHGLDKVVVERLGSGESASSALTVQADSTGVYHLTSDNFSYRDGRGVQRRQTDFRANLIVDPPRAPGAAPQVTAELQTSELPLKEWSVVRARISNSGQEELSDLEVRLSGQVAVDQRSARARLEHLSCGTSADVAFSVCAHQPGAQVPVYLDLAYQHGTRPYRDSKAFTINVGSPLPAPPRTPRYLKVLYLYANPRDTDRLRLDQEIREIQETIQKGRERDSIEVSIRAAVRSEDIPQALLDTQPRIVHFAGHGGGPEGSFVVEDEHGKAHIIPVEGLVRLFRGAAGQSVECAIVNACSTERLARGLATQLPYAIGMRQPVGDQAAVRFSVGFYQALAAGMTVEDAFDLGVTGLMMSGAASGDLAPVLFRGPDRTAR